MNSRPQGLDGATFIVENFILSWREHITAYT